MGDFKIIEMGVEVDPMRLPDPSSSNCYHRHSYQLKRSDTQDREFYEWHIPKHEDELIHCKIGGIEGSPEVVDSKYNDGRPRWTVIIRPDHIQGKRINLEFESYQPSRKKTLFGVPGLFAIDQYLFRVGNESEMDAGKFRAKEPNTGRLFMHGINATTISDTDLSMELNNQDPHSITFISAVHFKTSVLRSTTRAWFSIILPVALSIISSVIYAKFFAQLQ